MRPVLVAAIVMLSAVMCVRAADQKIKKINPNDPIDPKAGQPLFERVFGDYARLDPAKIKMIVDEAKMNGLGKGEPPETHRESPGEGTGRRRSGGNDIFDAGAAGVAQAGELAVGHR